MVLCGFIYVYIWFCNGFYVVLYGFTWFCMGFYVVVFRFLDGSIWFQTVSIWFWIALHRFS